MTRPIATMLLAGLLVLAGCSGGFTSGTDSSTDAGTSAGTDDAAARGGTVHFYVSDEENAISDFEHLNVTVTKVGFHRASGGDGAEDDGADGGTETETVTETETETETETGTLTATPTEESDDRTEDGDEDTREGGDDVRAGWEEFDVDNETVDLTRLQGENATLVDSFDLPEGKYTKVFLYVAEVNGTLKNGEQVTVKLPSEKLQLNEQFTVGDGDEVEFVFDITVHKAGKSGKYILSPVASESGTDVPVTKVDRAGNPEDEGSDADDEGTETPEPTESPEATESQEATESPRSNTTPTATGTTT